MSGLLASVPTIQEEAEPPMTDESQTSSGPGRRTQRRKKNHTVPSETFLTLVSFQILLPEIRSPTLKPPAAPRPPTPPPGPRTQTWRRPTRATILRPSPPPQALTRVIRPPRPPAPCRGPNPPPRAPPAPPRLRHRLRPPPRPPPWGPGGKASPGNHVAARGIEGDTAAPRWPGRGRGRRRRGRRGWRRTWSRTRREWRMRRLQGRREDSSSDSR